LPLDERAYTAHRLWWYRRRRNGLRQNQGRRVTRPSVLSTGLRGTRAGAPDQTRAGATFAHAWLRLGGRSCRLRQPLNTGGGARMAAQDLRSWIAKMDAAGEVRHISGADREQEIGGIVDFYQRKTGNPAVLFDDIPGYPKGHRVIANILTSIRRIHLTLGNDGNAGPLDLVHYWRRYMKQAKSIPPVTVRSSALFENVTEGKAIDLFKIPVPKWHELDGGCYIGTGDMVVMKHRDTGWINYG